MQVEVTASRNRKKSVVIFTKHEDAQVDVTAGQNAMKKLKQWILSYFVSHDEHHVTVFAHKNVSSGNDFSWISSFDYVFLVKLE